MRYLLKNAYLVLENTRQDIAVEDGVLSLSPSGRYDEVVDLENRMVLRGFWEMHTHLDKALISSRVSNHSGTLEEAISLMGDYKPKMTPEDIMERAARAVELFRESGTRFVRTNVDVDAGVGIEPVRVLQEVARRFRDQVDIQIVAFPQEGLVGKPENFLALDAALAAGAELVGGIPANEPDPAAHIEMVFDLAEKYNADVDMHIDETDDPQSLTLELLADAVVRRGWQDRVYAAHCCSLAANPPDSAARVLDKVKAAGIRIVSLPSTNLYLQGRGAHYNIPRGIAPIRRIAREYAIPVALGADNIQDPFNPFGCGNPLQTALVAAHGCHMGGGEDLDLLFQMVTRIPMEMAGHSWRLEGGQPADFIVLDATQPQEAIIRQSAVYARVQNNKVEV